MIEQKILPGLTGLRIVDHLRSNNPKQVAAILRLWLQAFSYRVEEYNTPGREKR